MKEQIVVIDGRPMNSAVEKILLPPIGFWSYARQDDELSLGRLSLLRSLLIQELQQQYGRDPVKLFQDTRTIPHGSDWEKEIRKALHRSMFFIPIITPNFLQSEWCCREVEFFLEQEGRLASLYPDLPEQSRIFPILFIDIDDVDPEKPEILAALQKLQWFDFRRFRHRSYDESVVREALSDLARTMRVLLKTKVSARGEPTPASPNAPPAPPGEDPTHITVPESPVPAPPKAEELAPPTQIAVGDVLNHMFEVRRFIKQGGMGQVFEGSNVINGERVAIKALVPALAAEPKVIAMFQREALTLTRLQHEALVQYRTLARDPQSGSLYIVTEYIDGVDLNDALTKIDRSPRELNALLMRLASGLAAAHKLGAIHRDISPDNVMLPDGDLRRAKIIDFGIAKDLGGDLPTLIGSSFAGKLSFVAPEQLGDHGGEIGPWTDIYSLGLLMLAVAGGAKADMGGSIADAIRKRRTGPDLAAAPETLRPLLEEMLRPDPANRLRKMEHVIARLAEVTVTESEMQNERKRLAEAEAERRAQAEREAEIRRAEEVAARQRAELAQRAAEEEVETRRKAEAEAREQVKEARLAAERESEARRKAEEKAQRQSEEARLAAEREAKAIQKAEAEATAKQRAEQEAKQARLEAKEAAEARRLAEAEAKRLAGIAAAQREAETPRPIQAGEADPATDRSAAPPVAGDEPRPPAGEDDPDVVAKPLLAETGPLWRISEPETTTGHSGLNAKPWIAFGVAIGILVLVLLLVGGPKTPDQSKTRPTETTAPATETAAPTAEPESAPPAEPASPPVAHAWLYGRWGTTESCTSTMTISGSATSLTVAYRGRPITRTVAAGASETLVRTRNGNSYRRADAADRSVDVVEDGISYTLWKCP